jgi:hypothetical protein
VLVVVLAGAAFVGARLLTGQGLPGQASPGARGSIQRIPAKELPQTLADAEGIFDHRKDNSIFVGTGQVRKKPQTDQRGDVTVSLTHDGPTVEVVVSHQTILYKDVTVQPPRGSGTITFQQVVEPGSLDEIGENCLITAWGKKMGDRIIADVLVYTGPPPVNNARP